MTTQTKRDFLSISDITPSQLTTLIAYAAALKKGEATASSLAGKSLALLLEKPSLRTRVSFELAMRQLGGTAISLGQQEVGLGSREPVADVARVLSRYVDVIAARVFDHRSLEELGKHATVPVINALSDREHPCQALGDLLTVYERFGKLSGLIITLIGDGNNVSSSLALGCAMLGLKFRIASPIGYDIPETVQQRASQVALHGWALEQFRDPRQAVRGADVIYTDVWVSMGQEADTAKRLRAFADYQVTPDLVHRAHPQAIFLHDLPAHHGEEISEGMLEHPQSAVFDQAENRLHAQKALLAFLLGAAGGAVS